MRMIRSSFSKWQFFVELVFTLPVSNTCSSDPRRRRRSRSRTQSVGFLKEHVTNPNIAERQSNDEDHRARDGLEQREASGAPPQARDETTPGGWRDAVFSSQLA